MSKLPVRVVRVVAALIETEGRYLVTQRRKAAVLANLWEFPGGKVEPGESDGNALKREIVGRLGVDIEVGLMISYVSHPYEAYTVDLYIYECRIVKHEPRAHGVQAFRWIRSDEFDQYEFAPADEASMSKLLEEDG